MIILVCNATVINIFSWLGDSVGAGLRVTRGFVRIPILNENETTDWPSYETNTSGSDWQLQAPDRL